MEKMQQMIDQSISCAVLPEEIIIDILSRVPVRSLIWFKSTCKPWRTLIRDPNFIKKHLHHAIEKNHFGLIIRGENHHIYSINSEYLLSSLSSSSLPTSSITLGVEAVDINYPFKSPHFKVSMLGSCHGLICFCTNWVPIVYIWNPCTQEYKQIPRPRVRLGMSSSSSMANKYGFGYDSKTEDYKLVRVVGFLGHNDHGRNSEVYVYTLGSNSWKSIPSIPYRLIYGARLTGVLINEAIHWIASHKMGDRPSTCILSFHFGKEIFEEMQTPKDLLISGFSRLDMDVLGGCLCVLQTTCVFGAEVWAMKKYGVTESWTKMFTFSPHLNKEMDHLKPIHYYSSNQNGDQILILKGYKDLVLYEPKYDRVTVLKIPGISGRFQIDTYVRSLVSLKSGTYVGQEKIEDAIEYLRKQDEKELEEVDV